jgi:predicted DNA-binding transcriptional regulator YafY
MSAHHRLIRQYQILAALSRSKLGLTAAEIEAQTEISRSTFYRDLDVLRSAGIPIDLRKGRYQFLNARELPSLGLSSLQLACLRIARAQLEPLGGTVLLQEFDRFLASLNGSQQTPRARQLSLKFEEPRRPALPPKVVRTIEKALSSRKRACIEYRAASRGGAPARVHIEPMVLSVADADPYVHAYCVERRAERTYKLARIVRAELTREPYSRVARSPRRGNGRSPHAIKAWSGPPMVIKVRLHASVAWLAREYPLPGQTEHPNPDGSVTLVATVAGLIEAQRRILAWGSTAEVLEPPELRQSMRKELAMALANYDGPGPTKAKEKSTGASRGSLKQGETGVG